jgi:peptidyl-tRNA hydrolase, PTH1 family
MAALSFEINAMVGLGNPGAKYTETRHNAGFWFVEQLADAYAGRLSTESKFHGEVARIQVAGKDIWLLKPDTFMNRCGIAVKSLLSFYKIAPENLLVVHDDIDLAPGSAKLKSGGGHGGHNGLRDIINHLGTRDFQRLRLGVGHPGNKDDVVDYVLQRPSKDDFRQIDDAIAEALKIVPQLASGHWEAAMQQLHTPR